MTKEELIKLSRENLRKSKQGSLCECYDEAFIKGYELSEKRIAELEEKISVLLSCKKCPENKGGYICQKEYEDKCLAQKIEFIKELQKENAELKSLKDVAELIRLNNSSVVTMMQLNNNNVALQKENADLKEEINKIAFARGNLEEENAELKSENQKWKEEWQEQVQKATDEEYARTLQTIQLTKAKELLTRLLITSCNSDVLNLLPNCSEVLRVRVEAEQFLSEEETKIKGVEN